MFICFFRHHVEAYLIERDFSEIFVKMNSKIHIVLGLIIIESKY